MRVFLLLLTILAAIGCDQSVDSLVSSQASDSDSINDNLNAVPENDNVADQVDGDSTDAMNDNSMPVDVEDGIDPEQIDEAPDAEALALDAIKAAGMAIASVLPITNVPDILLGIEPLPACPETNVESEFDAFAVGLDYGTGCATAAYPNLLAGGTVGGTLFSANAISVELFDTHWMGDETTGTVSGSFVFNTTGLNLAITVHIVHNGMNVDGQLQVAVDNDTADILVNSGSLTLFGETMPVYELAIEDAMIQPNGQNSFEPTEVASTMSWSTSTGEIKAAEVNFD